MTKPPFVYVTYIASTAEAVFNVAAPTRGEPLGARGAAVGGLLTEQLTVSLRELVEIIR
ncbi:MAG TPA: hypothetical protein VF219_20010 [Vicinamibacterales bacterium]